MALCHIFKECTNEKGSEIDPDLCKMLKYINKGLIFCEKYTF